MGDICDKGLMKTRMTAVKARVMQPRIQLSFILSGSNGYFEEAIRARSKSARERDSKSLPESLPSTRRVVASGINGMKLLPSHIASDAWDEGIWEIGRSR